MGAVRSIVGGVIGAVVFVPIWLVMDRCHRRRLERMMRDG